MKPSSSLIDGLVAVNGQFQPALVRFGHKIEAVEPHPGASPGRYVLPGFIDCHVHGGNGADMMFGPDAVNIMAAFHLRHGTTTLLPTTITAPADDLQAALKGVASVRADESVMRADIPGVHLEGPFINPDKLGAQPAFAIRPDLGLVDRLGACAPIIVATIAPEIDPRHELIRLLCGSGTRVQIGHSLATARECREALLGGVCGFTHLFNAMSGTDHRKPGVAAAALAFASQAELIADLVHVDPTMVQLACRAIPGLYAVTDAMAAAGRPPGKYRLGSQDVTSDGTCGRLADGTIAGSTLTMDKALRNFLGLGMPLAEASMRTSTIAAAYLGLPDRGRILPGLRADMVVVDRFGVLQEVYSRGRLVEPLAAPE